MSKSEGLKIGIRFTEDLAGDVSGNESAFVITGEEYKYVNGVLIDKEYQIEKIERYPVPVLYEDDFSGGIADGVETGSNVVKLTGAEFNLNFDGEDDSVRISDSTPMRLSSKFTLEVTVRVSVINVGEQYVLWKYTGGTAFSTSYGIRLNNNVWLARVTKGGTQISAMGTSTPIIGEWCHLAVVYDGSRLTLYVDGIQEVQSSVSGALDMGAYPIYVGKRESSSGVFDGYFNGDIKNVRAWSIARTQQEIQNAIDSELEGNETGLVGYWKLSEGIGVISNDSTVNANHGTINGATWEVKGYSTEQPATFITSPIDLSTLPNNPRIRWTSEEPASTVITVECAVTNDNTNTPATWTQIENGELLSIPQTNGYFLWLKYTLQTTDTTVTPTLQRVWLEEASAPQNKILITMDWWGKFNNVEDKIKVLYDASKGSLMGAGGAVESFEIEFTPQDLIQTPNPNAEELILAYPYEILLELKDMERINVYSKDATNLIKAYPYEIVLDLKDVSEINP